MDSKVIKGQAMIVGDSLVQTQTLILPNGTVAENEVKIIPNIWEDLTSTEGTFKWNAKKTFFYWEYDQTDSEDDTNEVKVIIECPKPKKGMYEEPYEIQNNSSEWEKFWLNKFKTAQKNYEEAYAIQKKEIIFPESQYVNQEGEQVVVNKKIVENDDLGDISNLLSIF
jgi:hypothetical protein